MVKRFLIAAVAVAALAVPGLAVAYGVQTGQNVTVPKGETKAGTYYISGQTVIIDGDVNGDLICAGSTVAVNGTVRGDVLCAGQLVSINGPVEGSVRLAGQSVNINNTVGRNATIMAQGVTIGQSARVDGDLGMLAQTASINGTVERDVYGSMQVLSLGGAVGPVDVALEHLAVGANAKVNGDLKYTSDQTFEINKDQVTGSIQRSAPPVTRENREAAAASAGFALRLYWILAALAIGLILATAVPRLAAGVTRAMLDKPGASLGWGVVATLLTPMLAGLLIVTLFGIPLGLLMLLVWILAVTLGTLFAGLAAGRWLLARADWRKDSLPTAALFGIPLAVILFSIPGLGGLIMFVATCWAVGGMAIQARKLRA